jgi:membrane protein DedA with SNARE-associated domain
VFDWSTFWACLAVFGSLVGAGLGFPIPEEIPIVTAGAMAGHADEPPQPKPPAVLRYDDAPDEAKDGVIRQYAPRFVGLLAGEPSAAFPANLPWYALVTNTETEVPYRSPRPWFILLPVCFLGVVISDGLLYGAGRFWGLRVMKFPWINRLLPAERFQRIQNNFNNYGVLILLFARLLPGIRAPVFLTAGIMKLPFRKFVLADGIYAIPGVSLLFFLAYWFTGSFVALVERAEAGVGRLRPILILSAVVAVTVYFVIHVLRRPVTTGDPGEIPLVREVTAKIGGGEGPRAAPEAPAPGGPVQQQGPAAER